MSTKFDKRYVLIDADGLICRAFYGAKASSRNPLVVLNEMVDNIELKILSDVLEPENIFLEFHFFTSSHNFKKDIISSYKEHRERDDELGEFRDQVSEICYSCAHLEADDIISIISEFLRAQGETNIYIISDDKDLKELYGKHLKFGRLDNIEQPHPLINYYARMLAGDKEDAVPGIPKVGMATAKKLLGRDCNLNLDKVFQIYKNKGLTKKYAISQVLQIKMLSFYENKRPDLVQKLAELILVEDDEPLEDLITKVIRNDIKYTISRARVVYNKTKDEEQ